MKNHAAITFMVAAGLSALVWVVSPLLTGHREPWDAESPFYVVALLLTGSVAGGSTPKPLWAHYLGAFVGQLSYEALFLKIGPLFFLGAVFLLAYSVVFLVAAAFAAQIRLHINNRSTVI